MNSFANAQRPGLSKDQTDMFKSLVISQLLSDYIKDDKHFFFTKIGAANVILLFITYSYSRYNTKKSYLSHQTISNILQKDQTKWLPLRFSIFDGFDSFFFFFS